MATYLQTGAPRLCRGLVRCQGLSPGLVVSAEEWRALKEKPVQRRAIEDGRGIRRCSKRAPGWR
jgi:hypothetical protein